MSFDVDRYLELLEGNPVVEMHGQVRSAVGLVIRAALPETWVGELCEVRNRPGAPRVLAEVVGFRGDEALLMPLGDLARVNDRRRRDRERERARAPEGRAG